MFVLVWELQVCLGVKPCCWSWKVSPVVPPEIPIDIK